MNSSMMRYAALLFVFMICFQTNLFAQDNKPTFSLGFDGQIAVTTDGTFVFANMGGPGIRMKYKSTTFSINMFPSLSFYDNPARPLVTPSLGAGIQMTYKRFVLCLPAYLVREKNQTKEKWVYTAGIGFKLSK